MKRVYRHSSRKPKHDAKSINYGTEANKQEVPDIVDDIQWDQGDLGTWHKHNQHSNHSNQLSHVTTEVNTGTNETPEHRVETTNNEILTEWDSQFDFCFKDSPNNSPVKSMLNKENSAKSSKDKFRAVIVKGKDFVKSKVNSCRDRFSRNSMKEVKKRLSNVTEDESEKGSNSCGNHRGSYSGAPQDQEQSNTEQMGTSADLKTIDMSCDKDVKEADWSGQNGNSKYENEENFMILPEVYTKYNGVSNDNLGQNHSQEKTDKIKENNGDITDGQKNGNQVEIVVVDEEENDYGNARDGDEEDQTVLDEAIPLGSEAQSFEESTRTETSQLEVPVDKKLKWLLGNLEQHSFGSDLSQNTATSNSSDISVDMLLNERSNDPEEILTNLGFGEGEQGDNPNVRIPGRFKVDQSGAEGVSITEFLGDNPELSQLLQAISDQQEGGEENLDLNTKDMDAMMAAGQGNPNYGNMLNSVMHGMKFLNLLSSAKSLNNLGEKPEEHPSILQNPKNREFLAQQGFYDRHKKKSRSESEAKANKLSRTQSLDASEKRKKFQATKSRNYSSLQNVPEQDEVFDPQKNGAGNYYSFGTSVGTGRSSSTDNYRPSMTSIETSTDSYDSGDSPGYTGRNGSSRSEPYLIQSEQMNIADSGIWNTEDSQRSVDEEYLSEFTRDSAIQRKSQVERMMSEDCYNVGDDTDILQSPPFSRTGSLESTLTASGIHKLETKSSTLKGHESFDDDVDIYSESYLPDKKNSIENGTEYADSIQRQLIEAESIKKEKFSPNTSMSKPESASGWKKFQRRYGVEMQINVPGVKNEADMANNNYDFCRKSENEIPVDGIQTDKPGLGVIGKIESVQSDSSGFAEAEHVMPEPVVIQKVSSLGSSTESDQTFKSSITILPAKSSAPKMSVTSPDGTQSISFDISGSESFSSSSKVDIAVGTDDFSEYLHAPNICYHLHERDGDDSGTYSENNKSVVLTIELPKKWVNSNPNKKIGKPRVISHLYKEIGHPTRSQSLDTTDSEANDEVVVMRRHRGQSNYPLERAASDSHVPSDYPVRSSTPHGGHSRSIRDSIMFAESGGGMPTDFPMQLLSTPHGHSRSIRDSIYLAETKQTFFPNQLPPRSTSPTSLSAFSAFGSLPRRTGSNRDHLESDSNLNLSSVSLVSQTDSVSSTSSCSLEYYKLMKLVNQPVSFKTDSKGRKGNIRFVPKFSVKEWTQLKKHQQLEEETKLAQHTLQRYKAELNMMESQFLVKTQLVKDDLSYSDREDVQELQYLFGELRKEMLLTEETLANRLDGINMGNDNYNPMLALDVIRKMTELLREQSYQQQMVTEKDEETMETTHSATWRSSGSQRLSEAKPRGSISDLDSEHSFSSSLSELKETILTEVRQELHDNTQWLHKELQKKERELNALKMELMSTNIKSGTTRKKHFYESDV